ncbi:MAG: M48 family metallopeptidase [Janthinobacterium lividum]
MPKLLLAYLAWTIAWQVFEFYLGRRQAASVRNHRDAVPAAFVASVPIADHRKAADYSLARLRFGELAGAIDLAVGLVGLLWAFDFVAGLAAGWAAPSILRSIVILGVLWLCGSLIGLPLGAWRDLVLEQRFGFNRKSTSLFIRDALTSLALTAVIGGPLLAGILWAMRDLSGYWWVWVWAALTLVMFAAPTIHVRVVAPLFNRFTPLQGELADRIEGLLARCGFRSGGLFQMDASKRSSRGNAYFIGFGPTKRIVLFDTLLEKHDTDEIEAVVAHELGHFRHHHTLFGMLRGIVGLFVMLAVVGWLARQPWLLPGFAIHHADPALALLLAVLLANAISPVLGLLGNVISRRHEFQADDFARRTVGAAPMISALTRLARDNASTLTPDRLFSLVHDTHPPVPVRVARLVA